MSYDEMLELSCELFSRLFQAFLIYKLQLAHRSVAEERKDAPEGLNRQREKARVFIGNFSIGDCTG